MSTMLGCISLPAAPAGDTSHDLLLLRQSAADSTCAAHEIETKLQLCMGGEIVDLGQGGRVWWFLDALQGSQLGCHETHLKQTPGHYTCMCWCQLKKLGRALLALNRVYMPSGAF